MSSLWGIGTTLYGKTDKKADPTYGQTYVTTKWFIICYLPFIPLKSMRIGGITTKSLVLIVYNSSSMKYYVLEQVPLQWAQIARTFFLTWIPLIIGVWLIVKYSGH
jgi:hypothetical protein